ncbi:hypothetical protein BKH46_02175 [Helicobacter sp. 12S02634-8]|uniref:hypothetical protein n=1 Tax=Helicobacter sp. 12S02634-8 TaxID=1476199 RepID=UPI000BA78851|nr:hypothetical protein [Helicobacter sp. 12S02634-8]PAF48137.1 hypothetical protein BKH46_02175 [Helicobacter sp. 12S02634-8]
MIIIGHYGIAYPKFRKVSDFTEIAKVENHAIVWFDVCDDKGYVLSHHCLQNRVKYALRVDNVTDFVIYAALKPVYIILEKSPELYQKIAECYLMDTKILYVIQEQGEIEELAKMGIDGVIFRQVLE